MIKNIFDRLATSTPVDKQTALSTSKGFVYEPDKTVTVREWDAPPKLKFPREKALDLTGVRFGRLTAIGMDATKTMTKHTYPTWVCRCDCGRYTSRRAKSIKNPNNNEDRCAQCLHVKHLQRRGRWIDGAGD